MLSQLLVITLGLHKSSHFNYLNLPGWFSCLIELNESYMSVLSCSSNLIGVSIPDDFTPIVKSIWIADSYIQIA